MTSNHLDAFQASFDIRSQAPLFSRGFHPLGLQWPPGMLRPAEVEKDSHTEYGPQGLTSCRQFLALHFVHRAVQNTWSNKRGLSEFPCPAIGLETLFHGSVCHPLQAQLEIGGWCRDTESNDLLATAH